MSKLSRWMQNYLIYSLPFVLVAMVWSSLRTGPGGAIAEIFWEVFSWNLILWFVSLFAFMFLIVFHQETREQVVRRVANIKERDERETFVTGQASRVAFVSSLSVLMLLLFLSIFTVNVTKYAPEQAVNGKTGELSLGLHFTLIDEAKQKTDSRGEVLFESKDIPLSKSAILLGLILWQLGSFNWSSRKLLREEG